MHFRIERILYSRPDVFMRYQNFLTIYIFYIRLWELTIFSIFLKSLSLFILFLKYINILSSFILIIFLLRDSLRRRMKSKCWSRINLILVIEWSCWTHRWIKTNPFILLLLFIFGIVTTFLWNIKVIVYLEFLFLDWGMRNKVAFLFREDIENYIGKCNFWNSNIKHLKLDKIKNWGICFQFLWFFKRSASNRNNFFFVALKNFNDKTFK